MSETIGHDGNPSAPTYKTAWIDEALYWHQYDIDAGRSGDDYGNPNEGLGLSLQMDAYYHLMGNIPSDVSEEAHGLDFKAETLRSVLMFGLGLDPMDIIKMPAQEIHDLHDAIFKGEVDGVNGLSLATGTLSVENNGHEVIESPDIREALQSLLNNYTDPLRGIKAAAVAKAPKAYGEGILGKYGSEFGDAFAGLLEVCEEDTRPDIATSIIDIITKDQKIGELFPSELRAAAAEAYQENVANLLFTLHAIKRGELIPQSLPLRNGHSVRLGAYTFEQALGLVKGLSSSLDRIIGVTADRDSVITRANKTGKYGLYKHTNIKTGTAVCEMIRLIPHTSYDPAIEYGTQTSGTQATIGFVTDEGRVDGYVSPFKKQQNSPFSIRIDNEGDTLALDIGSILGPIGSFGKEIADLIAIGDDFRSKRTGHAARLNHNSRPFKGTSLEKKETFAQILAARAGELEGQCLNVDSLSQLALKQIADA